jgi:probable rRNA maturation factor
VLEIEIFGRELLPGDVSAAQVRRACELALETAHVSSGHLAVELVAPERIAQLNGEHRGKPTPTDVLSFPIDGVQDLSASSPNAPGELTSVRVPSAGDRAMQDVPRELGDVVICPQHTGDLCEAVVHGVLHLLGMDHESDDGEMLALQARLLERAET